MSIKALVLVVFGAAAVIVAAIAWHLHDGHVMSWLAAIHGKH